MKDESCIELHEEEKWADCYPIFDLVIFRTKCLEYLEYDMRRAWRRICKREDIVDWAFVLATATGSQSRSCSDVSERHEVHKVRLIEGL